MFSRPHYHSNTKRRISRQKSAGRTLWVMFVLCNCAFVAFIVGARGIHVGADTSAYARIFYMLKDQLTFFTEPGFALLTFGAGQLGLSVVGYQTALFIVLLLTIMLATRKYFHYLGQRQGYRLFLAASLMMLFVSPFFLQASINGIRQGLSALVVFSALLAFDRRQWWQFAFLGAVATSFHYSSLLYLIFAPLLFLRERYIVSIGMLAFGFYCTGLSTLLIKLFVPVVYQFVMQYGITAEYDAGVRFDFAFFSTAFFFLPYITSKMTYSSIAHRIRRSACIYLIALLPFFAVGWGNFSNRYLFTAWMAISLMAAAVIINSRVKFVRNPIMIGTGLAFSSAVFYTYVYGGPLSLV